MLQSALKCSSWLSAFLMRRNMQAPDQRALYQYQCSHEEYCELQHLLRTIGGAEVPVKDSAVCASLTLFCSEWYRREYQREHAWTWSPIWKALGFSLSAAELSKMIPRGLEGYWNRPLHFYESERRDFLGSLFSEGGLPFQALREGGSRFQALFDRLLRQYDQWQLLGYSSREQVEQLLVKAGLPQVFAEPSSVELIARMADQLVALVRDYGLAQTNEPVARLNELNPRWREIFPLPLDNETGTELLNGLLKTATAESRKRRNASGGWSCRHFWHEAQAETLKVQISMPAELVLTLVAQPSTTRFELAIFEGDRVLADLGPGYAVVDERVIRIRPRQREVLTVRKDCNAPLKLVAMAGGVLMASQPIESSTVALGDVPLGFELENDRWQLCGQASFNSASEDLLLVLPDAAVFTVDEQGEGGSVTDMPAVCLLRAVRVQGKAQLQVADEEAYCIRTGHATRTVLGLELVGELTGWPTTPALTFTGLPRVQWPAGAGEFQQQGGNLFVAGKQPGDSSLQEMLGTQYISVRNRAGNTLLRRKIAILPSDFRVELRTGDQPGQGSVLLYSRQACVSKVLNENLNVQRIKHEDHVEFRLTTNGVPPARLRVLVKPNLLADPVEFDLPFPHTGCLAFDNNGKQLKRDLCLDDLLGARLFLFGREGASARFGLELSLKGNTARNACYRWSYSVADKPLEISLFNIREQIIDLLSLHSGIDQVVELRVSGHGRDVRYRICRYSMEMQFDSTRQIVRAINRQGSAALPKPVLMLLHEPMRSPIELSSRTSEGVQTGEFELPLLIARDGPWLVLPKSNSPSFRPQFLVGGWEPTVQSEGAQSLQKAVMTFDHDAPVSSFIPVLDAMAANPMHSGWQFLRALYESYGYLPLATFEAWKALLGHTRALAMALFKFEMDAQFLSRLEAEFPLFWEFLPIAEIQIAGKRFAAFLKVKGVAVEAVDALMGRMFSRLGEAFPAYGENVQRFLSEKPLGPEIKVPLEVFKIIVRNWYNELIRERSDAIWPEFGVKRLGRWHSSQSESVIVFKPEVDDRNAVVYLPVFAAAVASGAAKVTDVFAGGAEAIFFLRQVRDFDSKWFNAIYQYCVLNNVINMSKAASING